METGQYTLSQNFLSSFTSQRIQRQLEEIQNVMLLLEYMNDVCSYYHICLILSYTFIIAMNQMTKWFQSICFYELNKHSQKERKENHGVFSVLFLMVS